MNKYYAILFFTFLFGAVQESKSIDVSGNLIDNDTWTAANSPYNIVGDVGVPSGLTLTIEPDVVVNYTGDFRILVFGSIKVNGVESNKVTFNGNSVVGTKYMLEIRRTNLDNSNINSANFFGPQGSFSEGLSGETPTNTGILNVLGCEIDNSVLNIHAVSENNVSPAVAVPSVIFNNTRIENSSINGNIMNQGFYPCQFENGKIFSVKLDAGNYLINNSEINNSQFSLGGNMMDLKLSNSIVLNSKIAGVSDGIQKSIEKLTISNSKVVNTNIVSLASDISFTVISGTVGTEAVLLEVGAANSTIDHVVFLGVSKNTGILINNSSSSNSITNSSFFGLENGIKIVEGSLGLASTNFLNSADYHIENRSTNNVTATGNYWDSDSPTVIASKIYDQNDNLELGLVDISDRLATHNINAPISPPQNVVKAEDGAGGLNITWTANEESDVAGYKIYTGEFTGYSFPNVTDLGNVLTYNIPGLSIADSVAITAYDATADGTTDQVEGNESWFAFAYSSSTHIVSFSLPEQTGIATINAENHTIAVEVNYVTNPSSLIASFTLSNKANAKVGATAQESGTTTNDFLNPITYTITAEDGVTTQDWMVTVSVQPNPKPFITSFSPTSGPVGTLVTIIGTNFNTSPESNIVFFGATQATVSAATATELLVTVPIGATYQPITVLNNGLIGYSDSPFVVAFGGSGIDANSLANKQDISTSSVQGSYTVVAGDLNNNGKLDLLSTGFHTKVISIFKNISSAPESINYSSNIELATETSGPNFGPLNITLGDLDGDGLLDIVNSANGSSGGRVSIYKNNSDSENLSFDSKIDFNVGYYPDFVSIADLDLDGKVDIVTVNREDKTISILRNNTEANSNILFEDKIDFSTGIAPQSIVITDLDGDKKKDIVVVNTFDNNISIYRNNNSISGSISFTSQQKMATGAGPLSIAFGDYNLDNKIDIAVTNKTDASVSVFRNISTVGNISFEEKVDFSVISAGFVSSGDIDGDGKLDLVITNTSNDKISILKNNTIDSDPIDFLASKEFTAGDSPNYLALGDFDSDGKVDIACSNNNSNTISIFRNTISAPNSETDILTYSLTEQSNTATLDAPNHTVNIEVATGTNVTSLVSTFTLSDGATAKIGSTNQVNGTTANDFTNPVTYTITAENGTTTQDWVLTVTEEVPKVPTITSFSPISGPIGTSVTITGTNFNTTPSENIVFFGATQASITASTTAELTVTVPLGATYQPITVLNNGLIAYSAAPFVVAFGGDRIDANSFDTKVDFTTGSIPSFGTIADFDGDGKSDLAVTNQGGNSISVFRNTSMSTGTISYATKMDFTTGSVPNSVSAGDLDGDGKIDLVVTNRSSKTISIFRNTSISGTIDANSFATKVDLVGNNPYSVSIGDLDGDGKADLAVTNSSDNTVSVFMNTRTSSGILSFATNVDFSTGVNPWSISLGDLDGDGKVDMATANWGSSTVSIFRNLSTIGNIDETSFATKLDFPTGNNPTSVSIGDLDSDGKADMVLSNELTSGVSVLRNMSTAGVISYAAKVDYPTFTSFYVSIGDLDGDGRIDLAVTGSGMISVLKNTSTVAGAISFDSKVDFAGGSDGFSAIGDFDGDGKPELVVTNSSSDAVSIFRNTIPALSSETDILTFSFAEQSGLATIDVTNHTINIEVATGTNVTSLVSTFTLSDGATAKIGSTNQVNGTTANDFTNPVTYTITAENGTTTQDWVLTVTEEVPKVPTITSFSPISGPIGTSVTITGTNFNTTPSENIVFFGATQASITASTTAELTVTVPLGATYQPITVLNNGLIAYSAAPFVVAFGGDGIDANSFDAKEDFTTGLLPNSVSLSDLDGDNKVDVIVTNGDADGVSVFKNTTVTSGTIGYDSKLDFVTGTSPGFVSAGDLDGDGKIDLVIDKSGIISVLRNTSPNSSTVSFDSKLDFTGTSWAYSVAIGDIDGDGRNDLAAVDYGGDKISILRNTSSGTGNINFAEKLEFSTGLGPQSVSIGDLDGDGKVDLAIANNTDNTVSVLRNTSTGIGDISFASAVNFTTGMGPSFISLGDLDGDNKIDMTVANRADNTVSIFRNMVSDAGVISYAVKVDYTTGVDPNSVSIGDLDGDGKADLLVANYVSNSISVFNNTSSSIGSISYATKVDYSTGQDPSRVSIGDLDLDGKLDLVVTNGSSNTISIFRNTISAPSSETDILTYSISEQTVSATIDATNHTLNLEVANGTNVSSLIPTFTLSTGATSKVGSVDQVSGTTANNFTNPVTYTVNAENGTTTQDWVVTVTVEVPKVPTITSFSPSSGPVGTTVTITGTNFNTNPSENIVFFGATKAQVTLSTTTELTVIVPIGATYQPITVLNNGLIAYSTDPFVVAFGGDGMINASTFSEKSGFKTGSNPGEIKIADLDGDGKSEMIVVNTGNNSVSVFRNTSTGIGNISYAAKVDFITGESPYSVSIGDLNGNSKLDLVIVNNKGTSVSVLENISTGPENINFAAKLDITLNSNPYEVAIGDLDGDGRLDISIVKVGNTLSVFRNTSSSSISFAEEIDFEAGTNSGFIKIADLDGDTNPEMIVVNGLSDQVSVFRNTSTGIGHIDFAEKIDFTTGIFPISLSIGDLDRDGRPDIAVSNDVGKSMSVFRNTTTAIGSISYATKVDYTTGSKPYSISMDDLNGDGMLDIVVPNSASSNVSVFRNTSSEIGSISYATKIDYTTDTNPYRIAIGDLDSDGKSDLAVLAFSENIFVLRNTNVTANIETDFTSFNIPEQIGTIAINTTNHTIGISVPSGTNVTSLVSTFTLSSGATAKVGSVEQVSGTTANNFTNPITYTITAENGTTTQDWVVTVTIASANLNSETDILTYSIPVQTSSATINTTNHTIDIAVAPGTNITALVSNFTLSSGANAKVGATVQVSGSTANDFTNLVTYSVTAEDGVTTQDWLVTIVVATETIKPVISNINSNTSYQIGTGGSSISAEVTDDSNLSSVKVFAKKITGTEFISADMTLSVSSYTYTLLDANFDELGTNFFIEAIDESNNKAYSDTLNISTEHPANTETITDLVASSNALDYSIIAMPYQSVPVSTIFKDLMPHDKSEWRLFHYSESSGESEYPVNFTNFEPGKGYWFLTGSAKSVNLGAGSSVSSNEFDPFKLSLTIGWNMIGSPYPFVLDWAKVISHNKAKGLLTIELDNRNAELTVFVNRAYSKSTTLNKYQGAFVNATSAVEIEIPISAIVDEGGRIAESRAETESIFDNSTDNWLLELYVKNNEIENNVAAVGMHENALITKDYLDWGNLPRFSNLLGVNYLDITFEDNLSGSIVPVKSSYKWNFNVNNSFGQKNTTLTWNQNLFQNDEYTILVVDLLNQELIDLSKTSSYSFIPTSDSHPFELYYGKKDELLNDVNPIVNAVGAIRPNPFDDKISIPISLESDEAKIHIEIIDLLGRVIFKEHTVTSGNKYFEYEIDFNKLKSKFNNGTYILRIEIETESNVEVFNKKIINR